MPEKDIKYRVYIENIASLFAQGLSFDAVARKYDIPTDFLEKVLADEEFHKIFKEVDPSAYAIWHEAQNEAVSHKKLRSQVNDDAPKFYKIVADTVLDPNSSITDKERCDFALKLASLSAALKKDVDVEVVDLSEHQLGIINEAFQESIH